MCRSCRSRSLTIFHRVTDGNRQNATTAAGLPVHLSSRSNGRGVCNFDCEWRLVSTVGKCFTICALDVCGMCQQVENVRRAWDDECLSAGVYEFGSPAVITGHGFIISSLTLEFEYLFGNCPQDGNVSLGISIGSIVVHSRILLDNPSRSCLVEDAFFLILRWGCREHFVSRCWHSPGRDYGR